MLKAGKKRIMVSELAGVEFLGSITGVIFKSGLRLPISELDFRNETKFKIDPASGQKDMIEQYEDFVKRLHKAVD